ncbi:MAG: lysozyme [Pseudomonadota bacterium]
MRTGETGLNLIKGYEGLRMSAHYTPDEQWTVGYGHNDTARHGMSVTEGDAERLLKADVEPIEQLLNDTVRAPLNQNEHDALVSLIFNIGEDNWRRSTALRKLNEGDKLAAADAFEMWSKALVNNELVTLDGLVRRRAAEKSLFLMPTDASVVVPTSDVRPAMECEPDYVSEAILTARPHVDIEDIKEERARTLTMEEQAARTRALFAATQALSGEPTKMIISKEEEYADVGITVGAILAGLLAFALTAVGVLLLVGQEAPGIAAAIGLSYDRFAAIFENLPVWLSAIGAAMCYFILYILVKRSVRHDMKRQRARDMARLRVAE